MPTISGSSGGSPGSTPSSGSSGGVPPGFTPGTLALQVVLLVLHMLPLSLQVILLNLYTWYLWPFSLSYARVVFILCSTPGTSGSSGGSSGSTPGTSGSLGGSSSRTSCPLPGTCGSSGGVPPGMPGTSSCILNSFVFSGENSQRYRKSTSFVYEINYSDKLQTQWLRVALEITNDTGSRRDWFGSK